MSRSPKAVLRLAAALLLAAGAAYAGTTETAPSGGPDRVLELVRNGDLREAEAFLASPARQDALKAADKAAYDEAFRLATELVDIKGLITDAADARSIRLGVTRRHGCQFCEDSEKLKAWAKREMPWLDPSRYVNIDKALWAWSSIRPAPQAFLDQQKLQRQWPAMKFPERHAKMREWALKEKGFLLKVNPSTPQAMRGYWDRYNAVVEVLGNGEISDIMNRGEEAQQAVESLEDARKKVGASANKKRQALLAEANAAPTPEARLAILSKLFDNLGEKPRELLEAAPPRADQKFDDRTRGVVSDMLKTALLKETEGTFAGADLKEFYSKTPLTVAFTTTSMAALGWYSHGGDTLYFNERYVEQYIKSRGLSVQDVMKNPDQLGDLARTLVGTFVHEAQHHRQDVWAREQKMPRIYVQSDEVEAFQTQGLFLLEKLKKDPKFKEFAEREGKHSDVLSAGLSRARRMEETGPDWFEYNVPNSHYPEILSNAGAAWCQILRHNGIASDLEAELARRETLPSAEKSKLDAGPELDDWYPTQERFRAAARLAGTGSLRAELAESRKAVEDAPKYYNRIRSRRDGVRAVTDERYAAVMAGGGGRSKTEPPSPGEENR